MVILVQRPAVPQDPRGWSSAEPGVLGGFRAGPSRLSSFPKWRHPWLWLASLRLAAAGHPNVEEEGGASKEGHTTARQGAPRPLLPSQPWGALGCCGPDRGLSAGLRWAQGPRHTGLRLHPARPRPGQGAPCPPAGTRLTLVAPRPQGSPATRRGVQRAPEGGVWPRWGGAAGTRRGRRYAGTPACRALAGCWGGRQEAGGLRAAASSAECPGRHLEAWISMKCRPRTPHHHQPRPSLSELIPHLGDLPSTFPGGLQTLLRIL